MLLQLLGKHAAGLDEHRLVDGLVRHPHPAPCRVRLLAGPGDLLQGPVSRSRGASDEIVVHAGNTSISQGDPDDAFYVIADGRFGVTALGDALTDTLLDDLIVGDYFEAPQV